MTSSFLYCSGENPNLLSLSSLWSFRLWSSSAIRDPSVSKCKVALDLLPEIYRGKFMCVACRFRCYGVLVEKKFLL